MGKLYCICSGEYDDFHIDYYFTSEEKRNKLFNILGEDFSKCERELSDDMDINSIKYEYDLCTEDGNNIIRRKYTKLNEPYNSTFSYWEGELEYLCIKITEEQYNKGVEYYWFRVNHLFEETKRLVKGLVEDGMTYEEIEDIIKDKIKLL